MPDPTPSVAARFTVGDRRDAIDPGLSPDQTPDLRRKLARSSTVAAIAVPAERAARSSNAADARPVRGRRCGLWEKSVVAWFLLSIVPAAVRPVRVADPALAPAPRSRRRTSGARLMSPRPGSPVVGRGRRSPRRPSFPPTRRRRSPGRSIPRSIRSASSLLPHRRRLWLRRLVRRGWIALAAVMVAELAALDVARFVPLERRRRARRGDPARRAARLADRRGASPPTIGETALAVDAEGALGDRVSSALELAVAFPDSAGPAAEDPDLDASEPADEAAETDRFVRRQRRDALRSIGTTPAGLFRPRFSRQPATVALLAALLLVPVTLLPNPQDAVIAQQQQVREAAERQAERIDRVAEDLADKGGDAQDPRTRLAQELRDLARQLRERPDDLDANLARLGAIETDVRAQVDPANEQRAASLTALSRALSSAATGKPEANPDGDPAEGARRPQGPRRQARRADARAAARAGPPAGRPRGDGITGGRSGRNGVERCGPEPGAGRHGWGSPGAGSAG